MNEEGIYTTKGYNTHSFNMSLYTIGRKDDKISSLMQMNKELLEEDHFKDVTLVSDDLHAVKAHRALLSKSSDVLRQMLLLKDDKDPIIFIRGSSQRQLKSLLNFIYVGEAEVTEEDMNAFVQLAKDFKLKEFTEMQTKTETTDILENIELKSKVSFSHEGRKVNQKEKDVEQGLENLTEDSPEVGSNLMSEEDDIECENSHFYDPDFQEDTSLQTEADKKNTPTENGKNRNEDIQNIIKQEITSNDESNCGIECKDTNCNKIFSKVYNMLAHYRVSHEGFSLKCDICGYKTTRTNILRKHKQNNH